MRLFTVALTLVITSATVSGRLQSLEPPRQISNSGYGAYEVSLARIASGFAAAWYDTRDGHPAIYARLLDSHGVPAGPEIRLTGEGDTAYEADITAAGDELVVAWYGRTPNGGNAARFGMWNHDGTERWVKTLSTENRRGRNPVVRASRNQIFCAWLESDAEGNTDVWASWFNFDGVPLSPPRRVAPAGRTTWNLNATLDDGGNAWIAFDATVGTRSDELFLVRVDMTTSQVTRLTADDGFDSKYPDLAFGDGRVALTWFDERDGNEEVYLLIAPRGELRNGLERRARRVTRTRGESIGAYVAWNGRRFGLSWCDATAGQHDVYFQSFEPGGQALHQPRRLTRNPTSSLVPAIRPAGDGFALAWNEYSPPPRGVHADGGRSEIVFALVR